MMEEVGVHPKDERILLMVETSEQRRGWLERNHADSSKKNILWWIKSARRSETRAPRVSKTVEMASENRMANHPKGRDRGPKIRSAR